MKIGVAGPISLSMLKEVADIPHNRDGYAYPLAATLVLELVQRGHEIVVFTLDPGATSFESFRGERVLVCAGPYRPRHRARDMFKAEREVLRTFMETNPCDVIHAQWTYEFALAALSTSRMHTLVTVRDWAPTVLRFSPDPYRAVRMMMQARTLRSARYLTANSEYLADRVRKYARGDVFTVPNGIDDRLFDTPVRLNRNPPSLLAVNNGFGSRKNTKTLLRALPLVRGRVPGARLTMVGDDYEPKGPANRWANSEGLTEGIVFMGTRSASEIRRLMLASDLFVHPAREESFGTVLIEAMAARLPVVGGRKSGAVPWVLGHGTAGALVDIDDPLAIADEVVQLLTDQDEWARISKAGWSHASREFSSRKSADRYEQIYDRIANSSCNSIHD